MIKSKIIEWFKTLAGTLEYQFSPWNYASDELVVLCMHSTPGHMMPAFHRLLDFLKEHFTILAPAQLEAYFSGDLKDGPYVLFTFDDGLLNNRHAADALSAKGHAAYFFIVPDFVRSDNQEAYYRSFIRQHTKANFDQLKEDVLPLSPANLKQLLQQGHALGGHSMSHTMRATDSLEKTLREVEQCKSNLEELIGQQVDAFCSIVNTNLSVSAQGKSTINQHYRYHFTTFPGLNASAKDATLIFRRNIELDWTIGMIKYALGRKDLSRWTGEISRFQQL